MTNEHLEQFQDTGRQPDLKTESPSTAGSQKRLSEIDYMRGLCTLIMIFVHCYEEIYDGGDTAVSTLFLDFFNAINGASALMFCMGFLMDLKKETPVSVCLHRGVLLFGTGIFLNILRSPLIRCINFLTMDPDIVFIGMIDVLAVDILPFAGLAFMLIGFLKKLRLKPWGIFGLSVVLSGIGTLLRYTDTGLPVLNAVLAFFIGSNAESYFPLFHWFIFVAAGNLYRVYYTKITDKKAYYKIALPVSLLLTIVFVYLAARHIGPFQCLGSELCYYTWMNTADAFGNIAAAIAYMGAMWLFSLLVDRIRPKFRPLTYLSGNLPVLYFIHWPFLMFTEYILMDTFGLIPYPETDLATLLYVLAFLTLTIVCCELYKKYLKKPLLNSLHHHFAVWAVVIQALVILCVILSVTHGLQEIPSFLNDYTVDGICYL